MLLVRFITVISLISLLACTGDTSTLSSETDTFEQSSKLEHQPVPFEPLDVSQPLFDESLTGGRDIRHAKLDPNEPYNMVPDHLLDQDAGSAFSDSLSKGNRLMVYSAAVAAVELNPIEPFENYNLVMDALAEAINITGIRSLYVISHDANLRNQIKDFCHKQGYVFDGASNAISALKELHHSSARDLILIDAGLDITDSEGLSTDIDDEYPRIHQTRVNDRNLPRNALFARELFSQLKEDVRTNHIPVVIMAASQASETEISKESAQEIYGSRVAGVVSKPPSISSLKSITDDLFHKQDKLAKDAKDEAERLAIRACHSVANLKGKSTIFNTATLSESLIATFREPRGEQVARIPKLREAAIRAMQTVISIDAYKPLMDVARNPNNDSSVRSAAMDCLATIHNVKSGGIQSSDRSELIEMLSDRLKEDEDSIWSSAANAIGQLNLSDEEKTQLAISNRLNHSRKY